MSDLKLLAKGVTANILALALLDDYIDVVSKIEKIPKKEIATRIAKRAREISQDEGYLKDF